MKNKKNPFRVRPIRKSWHEKFWKKGTWRTHHTALFAMVLVLGVTFGFDAAFGADVSDPYENAGLPSESPAPLRITVPSPIDAAAPNAPTGAPTGASVVTPKFSGANIQGYVFNQVAAEDAETNPLQLYDMVNVWGGLNVINRIMNTGHSEDDGGLFIDPDDPVCPGYLLCDGEYNDYHPGIRVDDVLDVDHGILNTSTSHGGYLNLLDAVEISLLNDTNVTADGEDRMLVLNNAFTEADIEFNSPKVDLPTTVWEVGTGKVASPLAFYIENDVGQRLTIDEANGTTTVNQDLTVNGTVTAPIINATSGGAIGMFYTTTTSNLDSVRAKTTSPACTAGDTLIACGGAQSGTSYEYQGSSPSGLTCNASSHTRAATIPPIGIANGLYGYAFCFSPDGPPQGLNP